MDIRLYKVDVAYNPLLTHTEAMKKALNNAGYQVTDIVWPDIPDTHSDISAWEARELIRQNPYLYIADVN